MNVKAVFFDLVGTLVYTRSDILFENVSSYLFDRGYEVSFQQFKASWLFVTFVDYPKHCFGSWEAFIDRVLVRLGVRVDRETFRGLMKMFERHKYVLYPDAREAVPRVKDLGLKTAIVTTVPRFMFCEDIRPIKDYIDLVITGCEVGCDKSNPRMYLRALELLGVEPGECVVVGDDIQFDVSIPKRLGMYAILLDRRHSCSDVVADAVVRDLVEAVKIIKRGV